VPDGTHINIEDDLNPVGGTYGLPDDGLGGYWTPLANGVSNVKPWGCPYFGDVVERDFQLVGAGWNVDEYTPTAAQVTFILSQAPTDVASLQFITNGVEADEAGDYTVSGVTVTWLNTNYVMENTDLVHIRYK
jgi:hypothetical protein